MTDEKKLTEGMVVDVTWSWDKNPYNFVGEYLNFNLSIDITSITYKGKKVVPKKSYGEARAYLQDLLYDEYLQENADYVISVAIEPDLAFSGLDYYISTSFTIKNLLGKKTDYNGGYDTSFWANFKVVD
jgi:hypothetical protein